jgi:hypothetical protein
VMVDAMVVNEDVNEDVDVVDVDVDVTDGGDLAGD